MKSSSSQHGPAAAAIIVLIVFLAHRPRSPRQNSIGGASAGTSSIPSSQSGNAPVEAVATPTSSSPTAASPALSMGPSPAGDGKIKALDIHWWLKTTAAGPDVYLARFLFSHENSCQWHLKFCLVSVQNCLKMFHEWWGDHQSLF